MGVALDASFPEVLREALTRRKGESFERSLGRAIRRHGGDYADYVVIVSKVREAAEARHVDLWEAAKILAGQP